ncbi:MAG: hypothetical protein ACOC3C_04120 [Candidatus Thorarchaeota archaeon]
MKMNKKLSNALTDMSLVGYSIAFPAEKAENDLSAIIASNALQAAAREKQLEQAKVNLQMSLQTIDDLTNVDSKDDARELLQDALTLLNSVETIAQSPVEEG